MKGYINGIDFFNLEAMKYYAPPSSWSKEKIHDLTINRIFSGEWWGAQKRDGAFFMFIKDEDGEMFLRPRSQNVNKEYVNKIAWVPHLHSFFEQFPNGTCLLGELYVPSNEQAKSTTSIMNCLVDKAIKRQEKEHLMYYIFDILAWDGENWIDKPAVKRFNAFEDLSRAYPHADVEWAEYLNGKDLWDMLQDILVEGHEGVVITYKDAHYEPGKRSTKVSLKVKKELTETLDLVVIGANPPTTEYTGKDIQDWTYWFNESTGEFINKPMYKSYFNGAPVKPITKNYFYHWAGSLKLGAYKDGKLVEVGNLSGITEEIKENWKDYVGKVVEVGAMEIMDNAQGGRGIRHPKLIRVRDDKDPKDCTYDQIFQK